MFGDAAAAVRGSVLRHAGVGVEFDDSCKVALRDCVLEHNRAAFRVTPRGRPRAEILRCDISGELYGSAVRAREPLCVRPAPMAAQLGPVRWDPPPVLIGHAASLTKGKEANNHRA